MIYDSLSHHFEGRGLTVPSMTFFHLPAQKRERLLRCAREEFARVPYPEASINRIIRSAGIPRGSFYMYFTDKAELFSYLMGQYTGQFTDILLQLLSRHGGDLFDAFAALFDALQAQYRARCQDGALEDVISILRRNAGLPHTMALGQAGGKQVIDNILNHLDAAPLRTVRPEDKADILHILLVVSIPLICQGLTAEDPAAIRAKYLNYLEILKRGMVAKASMAAVSQT